MGHALHVRGGLFALLTAHLLVVTSSTPAVVLAGPGSVHTDARASNAKDDDGSWCPAELQRERGRTRELSLQLQQQQQQLQEAHKKLAEAEAKLTEFAGTAANNVCQYSASHATNVSGTASTPITCEQFPSGGDLTVSSTAPVAEDAFAVDVRTMTYSTSPKKDNTKFRRIVACYMAVGWASSACGNNITCSLGRLEQISGFWDKAAARKVRPTSTFSRATHFLIQI